MSLSIHHAFMVKSMELITCQRFSEWIFAVSLCVNLADFYHIIGLMFSYKMVTQRHSFLIQWSPRIIAFKTMPMLSKNIGDISLTFTPIDRIWHLHMTAFSAAFCSAINSATKVDVWTYICIITRLLVLNLPLKKAL